MAGAPAAEVIPRKSTSGFVMGFSFRAVCCIFAGGAVMAFSIPVIGGLRSLVITAPVWVVLLGLGLTPVSYIGGHAIDWVPIGVSYLLRRITRQHQYRRRVWRTRPAGNLALPGSRARLRMVVDEATGAVMVHDPHRKTLAASASVRHGQFMLADADQQTALGDGYATLLSTLGEAKGVARIQVLLRSMADAGAGLREYWQERRDSTCPGSLVHMNYEELLAQSARFTERHESTITVVLDLNEIKSSVRSYGGGLKGAAAVMRQRMRTLEGLLGPAGLELRGWLTPDDLAVAVHSAYDPAAAVRLQAHPEQVDDLEESGPMAVDGMWTHVRTDGARHKVMRIAKWPRMRAHVGFLNEIVLVPGVVVAVSLIYRPVPSDKAERDARHDDTREANGFNDRQRVGKRSTVVHHRDMRQAEEHLAELDAGYTDLDHAVMVTVSAPSKDALDRAVEDVRSAVRSAKCSARTLIGQQDELFEAGTMPLGLGVR